MTDDYNKKKEAKTKVVNEMEGITKLSIINGRKYLTKHMTDYRKLHPSER